MAATVPSRHLQIRLHDLRHTFGSMLAQRGISLYKISAMMGNSPEICRRHYAALIPDQFVGDVNFAA